MNSIEPFHELKLELELTHSYSHSTLFFRQSQRTSEATDTLALTFTAPKNTIDTCTQTLREAVVTRTTANPRTRG